MRKKVLFPIADGVEDIETVATIDVLRRAGAEVLVAAIDKLQITAARGIKIIADKLLSEITAEIFDLIVVPGGMPGAEYLRDCDLLTNMLKEQQKAKRLYAAICAAPVIILQHHNLLSGKRATCHPALYAQLKNLEKKRVVVDENCITSQGPGTAIEFALQLVELLFDHDKAKLVANSMVV